MAPQRSTRHLRRYHHSAARIVLAACPTTRREDAAAAMKAGRRAVSGLIDFDALDYRQPPKMIEAALLRR